MLVPMYDAHPCMKRAHILRVKKRKRKKRNGEKGRGKMPYFLDSPHHHHPLMTHPMVSVRISE